MDIGDKRDVLKSIDLLSFFHETTLERLAHESPEIPLENDQIIFNEGDVGGSMYIVLQGEVLIYRKNTDITVLGPGSFFGEMALIENQPRSASAKALENTLLLEIDEDRFQGYFAGQPQVLMAIMKTMSARFRKLSEVPPSEAVEQESPEKIREGLLRGLQNNLQALLLLNPVTFHIELANGLSSALTGYTIDELQGLSFFDLAYTHDSDSMHTLVSPLVKGTRQLVVQECAIRNKNTTAHPMELKLQWITEDQDSGQLLIHLKDITERKHMEDAIRQMAYYDSLTGLPNRNLLNDRLAVALARATRHDERVCIMFMDLDHFKTVNDTLGHDAGDHLLQEVARRVKGCLRKQDTVARMGGDEFIVLAPEVKEPEHSGHLAEKILHQFKLPVYIQDQEIFIGCSIGISSFPEDGNNVNTLLKNADLAMYRAKENGRNNYQMFTSAMNTQVQERMVIEKNLRTAITNDEFHLLYQPKVDLGTGLTVGFEALMRWESPELGPVPPSDFIPIAEENRTIIELGEWALRTACTELKPMLEKGFEDINLSVNLSVLQFSHPGLVGEVEKVLKDTGFPPQNLELEVTESILMKDAEGAVKVLNKLCALGLKISIDDFGTGFSSLNYLKNLPLHFLKIDRSFVHEFALPTNSAIIKTIMALAQSLGLTTIAEGIETPDQLEFLKFLQCDQAQGFLFSQGIKIDDAIQLVESGKPFEV